MRYIHKSWQRGAVATATLCFMGCAVGPNYHKPTVQIPESFKEGVDWQRAEANPQGSLSSTWWLDYHDDQLSKLIDQALHANQTIIAADAAYRLAQATVSASTAALYPTVSASASATRAEYGSGGGGVRCRSPGRVSLCHRRRFCELGARSVGEDPPPDRVQQGWGAGERRPARRSAAVDRSQCRQRLFCVASGRYRYRFSAPGAASLRRPIGDHARPATPRADPRAMTCSLRRTRSKR